MTNYFVTDGAGFIGSHLVDKLMQPGNKVVVYNNLASGKIQWIEHHFGNDSFQFIQADLLDELLAEARQFATMAPNVVIKIPQENQFGVHCYGVMRQLESEGIKVNATVALSLGQVILSAKTGATYISIFAAKVGDEGGNHSQVIVDSVDWLKRWNYKNRIIVGSIRYVADVLQAAMAGAHVITILPRFIPKMADHNYTKETIRQFIDDAQKTLEMIEMRGNKP